MNLVHYEQYNIVHFNRVKICGELHIYHDVLNKDSKFNV